MEQTAILEPIGRSEAGALAAKPSDYALSAAVVYQDGLTREWAMQVCARATNLVGPEYVRTTWWKTKFLNHPRILREAVQATVMADVIMVAVWATRQVPRELSRWSEGWLAQRPLKEGALLALIGRPGQPDGHLSPLREYLRAVADRSHLDFLSHEFKLPGPSSAPALEPLPGEARSTGPLAHPNFRPQPAAFFWSHWGLNE
jgi:hypothetical protein